MVYGLDHSMDDFQYIGMYVCLTVLMKVDEEEGVKITKKIEVVSKE